MQLASVIGKNGNEFYFQRPSVVELLAKLFVKLPRNPTKRTVLTMRHDSVETADAMQIGRNGDGRHFTLIAYGSTAGQL